MKHIFLFVCILTFIEFSETCFAKTSVDTTDNWQVYYNSKLIGRFPHYPQNPSISISRAKVKINDTLKLQYFRDAPCTTCVTGLYILNKNKKIIFVKGKGTFTPLKVALNEILNYASQNHIDILDFYYYDYIKRNTFVFKLKLE
jgi:hypothetical protein